MGQYYLIVNLDKQQFLHPHKFGSGMKLTEFSGDYQSVMQGLAILLADGNNRGGGDLNSEDPIIGSWAGDRIVISGDYADVGKFVDDSWIVPMVSLDDLNVFTFADKSFEDLSDKIIQVIAEAEGSYNRMSKLDLSDPGFRRVEDG